MGWGWQEIGGSLAGRGPPDEDPPGCYLTTDADGNDMVNKFYQSLDWRIESTYATPEGRRMNRYVFDFGSD